MKYLIVGLGNIGPEYAGTRHNIGFRIADKLADMLGITFSSGRYGDMAQGRYKNKIFMILKPSTFMNLSGVAIRYWMNKEKIKLDNLLVCLDDIALPFGTIRLRPNGSAAGHNGLKNITEQLGTPDYSRLRFGVGNNFSKGHQIEYVLGHFSKEEEDILSSKIDNAAEAAKAFVMSGVTFAMTNFNNK